MAQRPGGPEVLAVAEVAPPTPSADELLVQVAAAGVNFVDTYRRSGAYATPFPHIVGVEGAGVVTQVGADVTDFVAGDRVAWVDAPGSYAEQVSLPAAKAAPVPEGLELTTAAAVALQGITAQYLVNSTYAVRPGDEVLVHAAAGGVGLVLVQLVTLRGGRVIGTVSTEEKERLARAAGADHVIRYTEVEDVAAEVRKATEGRGVAVVYDGVGKDTFEASLASLRTRGMLVLSGASSGKVPPFDPQRLNPLGSLYLTRPTIAHYTADHAELTRRAQEVFDAVVKGQLHVTISQTLPLAQAADAHRALEGRRTVGKLILVPD